jgi:hypothetical protein
MFIFNYYNNIFVFNSIIFLYSHIFEYSYRIPSNKREIEMKKNGSLLVLGIVSISLLLILSVIQSSTAQRYDDDDKDNDKDKWNRHDDDKDHDKDKWNRHDDDKDHDKDKWKWNRHDDNDHHHDHDNFDLTVRLISDEERHIPDYKVKVSGETKSIDGEEFEDDGKANVKFNLNDVDNKEKVCITNERTDDETCKRFNTDGDEGTVKFNIG